jgi:hypothetical protein
MIPATVLGAIPQEICAKVVVSRRKAPEIHWVRSFPGVHLSPGLIIELELYDQQLSEGFLDKYYRNCLLVLIENRDYEFVNG